ncbi:hypothetical protein C8F04DRAFT_69655 [Mycena alexandri]|uniref:Extracellular serine-rich protein n=1 Tax=Mycena alexandri TaxID=1745969 RepID=A0AAD6SJ07_9AGAR|nr:hypothetical protein C8F04DRAFT_69655 [Mycena alexandri]
MLEPYVALFLALFLTIVVAQTTHFVNVGVEGSFYSPPTISAGLNDTVTFIFGGDSHTVTQSSFNSPCIRLDGGFDSGFNGRGADFSKPAPVWSLRITNVSETIWFFCEASIPSSHCFSGMVGAINPPSILMYNEFVSAARLVTSTPKPSPSFIASGEGAFATNSPIPSSISMTSPPFSSVPATSSSSSILATSSVAATPPGSSESRTNVGLIAGCATAGGVVVLILAFLAIRHCRRRTAYRSFATPTPASMRQVDDGMLNERSNKSPVLTYDPTSSTVGTHTFPVMTPPSTAGLYNDEDADKRTNASAGSTARPIRPLPRTHHRKISFGARKRPRMGTSTRLQGSTSISTRLRWRSQMCSCRLHRAWARANTSTRCITASSSTGTSQVPATRPTRRRPQTIVLYRLLVAVWRT